MHCDLITKWVQDASAVLQIDNVGKEVTFELITLDTCIDEVILIIITVSTAWSVMINRQLAPDVRFRYTAVSTAIVIALPYMSVSRMRHTI
jgi:hypothetical protein